MRDEGLITSIPMAFDPIGNDESPMPLVGVGIITMGVVANPNNVHREGQVVTYERINVFNNHIYDMNT